MSRRRSSPAAEHPYLVVFASQPPLNRPRLTHSFAAFLTAATPADPANVPIVPHTTISWLPSTMVIRLFTQPQPGTNFDMPTTIDWALGFPRTWVLRLGPLPHQQSPVRERLAPRQRGVASEVSTYLQCRRVCLCAKWHARVFSRSASCFALTVYDNSPVRATRCKKVARTSRACHFL